MARPAAQLKGLYYPTSRDDIQMLSKHIKFSTYNYGSVYLPHSTSHIVCFDPCAGEGDAVKQLFSSIEDDVELFGVELEENRAKKANTKLSKCLHGDALRLHYLNSPSFIFCNPPYDTHDGKRVELTWIEYVANMMADSTYALFILPEKFITGRYESDLRLIMYKYSLTQPSSYAHGTFGALKFVDDTWSQYALLLKKNKQVLQEKIVVSGCVSDKNINQIDIHLYDSAFEMIGFTKNVKPSLLNVHTKEILGETVSKINLSTLQPLSDFMSAIPIAAGTFAGIKTLNNKVVRGSVGTKYVTYEDKKNGKDVKITKPVSYSTISVLDLKSGDITSYRSDNNSEKHDELLLEMAPLVKDAIEHEAPPEWNQQRDFDDKIFAKLHAPRKIAGAKDALYDAQKHRVSMILKRWEKHQSVLLSGAMGTGKTSMMIAASAIESERTGVNKVVVVVPAKNDLVKNAIREIELVAREYGAKAYHVQTQKDVDRAFKKDGLTYLVIKESFLKAQSPWTTIHTKVCPTCNKRLVQVDSNGDLPTKSNVKLYCSECGTGTVYFYRKHSATKKTYDTLRISQRLGLTFDEWKNGNATKDKYEALKKTGNYPALDVTTYSQWKGTGNHGKAKYPLAKYISKKYTRRYILVVDEAHEYAHTSNRGIAMSSIVSGCKRALMMTGTFYNGKADSIFNILYMSQPSFRDKWDKNQVMDFVRKYGFIQEVSKENRVPVRWNKSGYYVSGYTKREEIIPGIHPQMIADMLPYTVFISLPDIGISLPAHYTKTLFVDIDKNEKKHVDKYLQTLESNANVLASENPPMLSLRGQLQWAKKGAYNTYPIGDECVDEYGNKTIMKKYAIAMTKKEEAFFRLLTLEKSRNAKVIVYYDQIKRRGEVVDRLIKLGSQYGFKIGKMEGTQSSAGREAYINKMIDDGYDAIITNPNLVKVGLNLLRLHATIWYTAMDDAITVSQASQRINRIGKTRETNEWFLGWNNTPEAEIWSRTAKKVQAMNAISGNPRAGLAAILGEDTIITNIQSSLNDIPSFESDFDMSNLPKLHTHANIKANTQFETLSEWASRHNVKIIRSPRAKINNDSQLILI